MDCFAINIKYSVNFIGFIEKYWYFFYFSVNFKLLSIPLASLSYPK